MARPNEESEVIGHYLVPAHGRPAQPLLHESTVIFQDVVSDKLSTVEVAVEADAGKLNQFFLILHWASDVKGGTGPGLDSGAEVLDANAAMAKASVMVKQRTLLMIAAHAGSLRVLSYLLSRGAEPSRKSPDGLTAYDMALAGESSQAATALAMMRDADSHPPSSTRSSSATDTQSYSGTDARGGNRQDLADSEGSSYSTTDLTRPEYSTDDFRMFNFKVLRCSKRHAHDWRACPFAHPTENARRRDPREFKYCALACPDYKQGFCIRGDVCPYAHGVFECWLHPSRYRTQLCKDGANCHRPVCFFAHSLPELRAPTYTWVPSPADLARPAANANANSTTANTTAASAAPTLLPSPSATATSLATVLSGPEGNSPGVGSGSPLAPVATETRAMLSHASSGIPATSSSSDDSSSVAAASCSSPRAVGGSSGMMVLMMGGGAVGMSGAMMMGPSCNGNTGSSSSCSSGANGSPSPSCSVGSKDGSGGGGSLAAAASGGMREGKGCHSVSSNGSSFNVQVQAQIQIQAQAQTPGSCGKICLNLTQPNAAASMLGFTAPRMSNAFARRHGLNPKDNPMLNLQKIALQSQPPQTPQQQQQQQPQQQAQPQNGSMGMSSQMGNAYPQDCSNAPSLRNHQSASVNGAGSLQSGGNGNGRNNGFNGNSGGQRFNAAAVAAAAASNASSQGSFSSVPFGSNAASAFGVAPMHMQMHAAAAHLSNNSADPSLLAAQLAALNLQQQRQQHLNIGMGIGGMNMTSGAAAAAAVAAAASMSAGMGHHGGQVQYMNTSPHHALMHSGMYGSTHGSMYDHPQQHLIAAMSGAQTEV